MAFPVKESFLQPINKAPGGMKPFKPTSSLTPPDDDRSYTEKLKDDLTETAERVAGNVDLEPKAAPKPEPVDTSFGTNRAVQAVEQALKVKTSFWKFAAAEDDMPWADSAAHKADHCVRLHCVKCGCTQTCRCSQPKKDYKGVCCGCRKDDQTYDAEKEASDDMSRRLVQLLVRRGEFDEATATEQEKVWAKEWRDREAARSHDERHEDEWGKSASLWKFAAPNAAGLPTPNVIGTPTNTLTGTTASPVKATPTAVPTPQAPTAQAPAQAPAAPKFPQRKLNMDHLKSFLGGRAPTQTEQQTFYRMNNGGRLGELNDPATVQAFRDENRAAMRAEGNFIQQYEQAGEDVTNGSLWNPMTYWRMMNGNPDVHMDLRRTLAEGAQGVQPFTVDDNRTGFLGGLANIGAGIGNTVANTFNPSAVGHRIMGNVMDIGGAKLQASDAIDRGDYLDASGNYLKAMGNGIDIGASAMPFAAPVISGGRALLGNPLGALPKTWTPQFARPLQNAIMNPKLPLPAAGHWARPGLEQLNGAAVNGWRTPINLGFALPGQAAGLDNVVSGGGNFLTTLADYRSDDPTRPHATGKDVAMRAVAPLAGLASFVAPTTLDIALGGGAQTGGQMADAHDQARGILGDFNANGGVMGLTHDTNGRQLDSAKIVANIDKLDKVLDGAEVPAAFRGKLDTALAQAKEDVASGDNEGFGLQALIALVSILFGGGMLGGNRQQQVAQTPAPTGARANNTELYG